MHLHRAPQIDDAQLASGQANAKSFLVDPAVWIPRSLYMLGTEQPPTCARYSNWRIVVFRICLWICAVSLILGSILWAVGVQAAEFVHLVTPGESLAAIAQKYNISLDQLSDHNQITNPNHIVVGQKLAIPTAASEGLNPPPAAAEAALPGDNGYHSIVVGDSLSQIAKRYGLTLNDLMRFNSIENPNNIYVGQILRLSARVEPVTGFNEAKPQLADLLYVVQPGDSLAKIAIAHGSTVEQIMATNGLVNPNAIYYGQSLRIKKNSPEFSFGVAGVPADGKKLIEINLSTQTLTAWQGDVAVMRSIVATGKATTPTVTGRFAIGIKYDSQHMWGDGYDLPGVPWVMYFFEDYAIHGAYWHANFGTPTSRGCVNMKIPEAEALYKWAGPGTEVWVHY
jgi:LysM repeat protein